MSAVSSHEAFLDHVLRYSGDHFSRAADHRSNPMTARIDNPFAICLARILKKKASDPAVNVDHCESPHFSMRITQAVDDGSQHQDGGGGVVLKDLQHRLVGNV